MIILMVEVENVPLSLLFSLHCSAELRLCGQGLLKLERVSHLLSRCPSHDGD